MILLHLDKFLQNYRRKGGRQERRNKGQRKEGNKEELFALYIKFCFLKKQNMFLVHGLAHGEFKKMQVFFAFAYFEYLKINFKVITFFNNL